MKPHRILITLIITSIAGCLQIKADTYQNYIEQYSQLAIEQQQEYGIPASITLAQGILESGAGRSTLAREGNNHFGIKCHREWSGDYMLRNDDRPNECFRVYNTAEESFRDHSIFLTKKRYESLFSLDITDYEGWAYGLKRCGYATAPNYGERLVAIIEKYGLYAYDTMDVSPSQIQNEEVEEIKKALAVKHKVRKVNDLYYVVAMPGDSYKTIAQEFGIKEKLLRNYNDASKNASIEEWEEIYLQPKNTVTLADVTEVTIGENESMRSISQHYGITLRALRMMNKYAKDRPGTILRLK